MSITKEMEERTFKKAFDDVYLKQEYNKTLQRYYNGCKYIDEHIEEADKYLPVITELLDKLNSILKKIPATDEEVLNGFKT